MPALLLLQPPLQRLHDLVPGAERLDLLHLLGRQVELGDLAEPFLGDFRRARFEAGFYPLEDFREDLVEAVEQPLVLHEGGAGEIVEFLGATLDHLAVERVEQHQMLLHRHGNARVAQLVEEVEEHEGGLLHPSHPRKPEPAFLLWVLRSLWCFG